MNSGEHFRRTLNTQRTSGLGATALPTPQPVGRSLPYAEIYGLQHQRLSSRALGVDVKTTIAAGPISESAEGPAWRATALSLFFAQSDSDYDLASTTAESARSRPRPHPACPSLVECCLRVLLEHFGSDVATLEQLASYLAPHHRKEAMRMCAVRSPLSGARLRALLGGEGRNHVEGELVVVQPALPLRQMFRQHESGSGTGSDWQEQEQEQEQEQQPHTAVAIVSTLLLIPVLLALPSSLTRLALVRLSAPIPVHRLPDRCPLLDFLDLSYNPWLAEPAWGRERALERVAWGRWVYLKVLGCRDCGITLEELGRVNEGRWEDVRIVI